MIQAWDEPDVSGQRQDRACERGRETGRGMRNARASTGSDRRVQSRPLGAGTPLDRRHDGLGAAIDRVHVLDKIPIPYQISHHPHGEAPWWPTGEFKSGGGGGACGGDSVSSLRAAGSATRRTRSGARKTCQGARFGRKCPLLDLGLGSEA